MKESIKNTRRSKSMNKKVNNHQEIHSKLIANHQKYITDVKGRKPERNAQENKNLIGKHLQLKFWRQTVP